MFDSYYSSYIEENDQVFWIQEDGHRGYGYDDEGWAPEWIDQALVFTSDNLDTARAVARWMSERTSRMYTVIDSTTQEGDVKSIFWQGSECSS